MLLSLTMLLSMTSFATGTDEETTHYYPDELSGEMIESVIAQIANGDSVVFGDGVTETFGPPSRWASGSSSKTHQWLAARAFILLSNEQPTVYSFYTSTRKALTIQAADYPDLNDTELFINHFYHYPTGTNWGGSSSDNALQRFTNMYQAAVASYEADPSSEDTWDYLGSAIHYLSDMGCPKHTGDHYDNGDIANMLIAHTNYEEDAEDNKSSYAVTSGGYYSWYSATGLTSIGVSVAQLSHSLYNQTFQKSTNAAAYWNSIETQLKYSQRDVADLLYKFYLDTH